MDKRFSGGIYELRLNNKNIAMIAGTAALVLVVVFSIGVVVGNGLSKIGQVQASNEYEVAHKDAIVVEGSEGDEPESDLYGMVEREEALQEEAEPEAEPVKKDGVTYAFYKSEEGAPNRIPEAAPEAKPAPKEVPKVRVTTPPLDPAIGDTVQKRPTKVPEAVVRPKPIIKTDPKKPAPKVKAGDSKQLLYTVQVAAFPTEPEAKRLTDKLVKKGLAAYTATARVKGNLWYRVRVGKFASKAGAQDMAQAIEQKEGIKPFIDVIVQ